MKRLLTIAALSLALGLSGQALAAGLPQLRSEVAAADGRLAGVRTQRAGLQRTLDDVARQIESLKARQASGLFGSGELDELLKRSQELSSKVTEALKSESEAEESLRGGQTKLVTELDQELNRLRARWDAATTRPERQALVQQLKGLRGEREALRRAMPSTLVPTVSDRASDDPEELLERADALLDGEDKLRREQQALERRIAELRSERDLERRMNEFMGEDALFDEHDRVLSATRTPKTDLSAATTGTSPGTSQKVPAEAPSPSPGSGATSAMADGERTSVTPGYGGFDTNAGKTASPTTRDGATGVGRQDGAEALTSARATELSKAPPDRRVGVAPYSEDEGVDELVARREQLKKLADDMHRKADDAVAKAKTLK